MESVGNVCVTEVDSSKVGLGQFPNSNSFLKFVHFNFFSSSARCDSERVCVRVKELVLAMVSFRDHVWVKHLG